ncbi:hypothetical protein PF011_g17321 [Phytophthora fragariae]|uniref:Uncharacterized protein n=1 Tax=Phytophthora fragariae TaxID=53985 RepID=A0A6A3JKP1_9STRA|nr:hypothetical protein PF011_g17321 [Phytophthora fragariae]
MRSTFSFDDDKQLVQIARTFIDAGTRIAWVDVARRMRPAEHSAAALRQRLQTLFRTWGRDITRFPPSFFTEERRSLQQLVQVMHRLLKRASQLRCQDQVQQEKRRHQQHEAHPRRSHQPLILLRNRHAKLKLYRYPPVGGPPGEVSSTSAARKIPAPPVRGPAGEEAAASRLQ